MKDSFHKFLQGKADERETRQLEELLSRDTVADEAIEATSEDSMLMALRAETQIPQDAEAIRQMTEQLEKLIPRPEISAQEIRDLLEPADSPDLLGRIGKYQITQYLASGGMGLVFRANDSQLNREVCLKLLHPIRARGSDARTRFERESRAIARLNCERIMPILDIGNHGDLPFLVMPLLEGASLRTLLLREGQLPAARAVRLATQIAEGLDFAHQLGVLHRDIKPDNLWVTPSDDIKLLDFGLARSSEEPTPITHEGTVLGTPSYMSPEQVTGKPLDGRSDLFSLGVVLIEMLTGQSPFRKNNLFSTLMSVASDEINFDEIDPDSTLSPQIRKVLVHLLQKNPDLRPANATEVVKLLKPLSEIREVDSARSLPHADAVGGRTPSGWRSWSRSMAAALAGFALCLGALAIWQMNDKGTLVVKTSDPQVEVKIAGEKVTVVDPLTSRSFEIRIGETPLPSGVYQLEMAEANRELVFSSQTIAIRRGEQTIVTVELKPTMGMPNELPVIQSAQNPNQVQGAVRAVPGATLAVNVPGVLTPFGEAVPILQVDDYPPARGLPVLVKANGTIALPLLGEIPVAGLSMDEIVELIRKRNQEYGDQPILPENFELSVEMLMQPGQRGKIRNLANQTSVEGDEIASDSTEEKKVEDSPKHFIPPLEPVPADQIVDKSFDPEVRDRFAKILATLPALSLEKHLSRTRLSNSSVVTDPRELKGFSAWSLDVAPVSKTWEPNSDKSLFATKADQVWIVDATGTSKYVLPSPGRLIQFAFDPHHPNLIATSSWTGQDQIGGNFGPDAKIAYQIQVWRLSSQGAELVRDFPSSRYEFLWDHGYRLIHEWQDNLVAHRLDTDQSHVLTKKLDNWLWRASVSPGGRFLATRNRSGISLVNLYDLHRGTFVSTVRLGGEIQWRSDDAALAITGKANEFLEIWRTDLPEFLRRVEFDKWESGAKFEASLPVLDASFSKVAQLTQFGNLRIRSLINHRESSTKMEGFKQKRGFRLSWETDGALTISSDDIAYDWRETDSEVHGTMTIREPLLKQLNFANASKEYPSVFAVRDSALFLKHEGGTIHQYNLAEVGREVTLPVKKINEQQFETMSPDGRFAVEVLSSGREGITVNLNAKVNLIDMETNRRELLDSVVVYETRKDKSSSPEFAGQNSLAIQWSDDGRYLLLFGRRADPPLYHGNRKLFLTIWDTKNGLTKVSIDTSTMEKDNFFTSVSEKSFSVLAYREGFLLKKRFDVYWVQPGVETPDVLDFSALKMGKLELQKVAGDFLFISTPGEDESQTLWHRGKIENGQFVLDGSLIAGTDDRFEVSDDGGFFFNLQYDPASIKVSNQRGARVVAIQPSDMQQHPGKVIVGSWPEKTDAPVTINDIEPIATWEHRESLLKPVWHQNGHYMAINDLYSYGMFLLDLESGKWSRPALPWESIHSTDFGWLVETQGRFAALNPSGELLGSFFYLADLKNSDNDQASSSDSQTKDDELSPLKNGRWILADGSTLKGETHSNVQLLSRRENLITVESFESYLAHPENEPLPEIERIPFVSPDPK